MSRTFSTKSGSGESLKVSRRWGLNPKACQIRFTFERLIPVAAAMERIDQWVASLGVSSRVLTTTRSTSSSLTERATPGAARRGGRRGGVRRTVGATCRPWPW